MSNPTSPLSGIRVSRAALSDVSLAESDVRRAALWRVRVRGAWIG